MSPAVHLSVRDRESFALDWDHEPVVQTDELLLDQQRHKAELSQSFTGHPCARRGGLRGMLAPPRAAAVSPSGSPFGYAESTEILIPALFPDGKGKKRPIKPSLSLHSPRRAENGLVRTPAAFSIV
jgi:hypothetical protein